MTHPVPVTSPPSRERRERPRTWLAAAVLVWLVVLVGGIGWAVSRGGPTAREQTTVADARPVVDRAVAQIADAATGDGHAVAAISGFNRVGDCRVTVLRRGERYQRTVTVVVTPGTEKALIDRVGARLPASYGVRITGERLVADAGFWVQVTASAPSKGQVQFVADTGSCRETGALPASVTSASDATAGRAEVTAALSKLSLTAAQWHSYQASCPGGGQLTTVEAVGPRGAEPGAFNELLRGLGNPVVATPDVYAYTSATYAVAVRHEPDNVVVTATHGCA
jgi:hypothetical protein